MLFRLTARYYWKQPIWINSRFRDEYHENFDISPLLNFEIKTLKHSSFPRYRAIGGSSKKLVWIVSRGGKAKGGNGIERETITAQKFVSQSRSKGIRAARYFILRIPRIAKRILTLRTWVPCTTSARGMGAGAGTPCPLFLVYAPPSFPSPRHLRSRFPRVENSFRGRALRIQNFKSSMDLAIFG